MTDTQPEISQEAARAMLAALREARRAFRFMVPDDGSTADHAARVVENAIALAEGRAS